MADKARKIKAFVEAGSETFEDVVDLPEEWDSWPKSQQEEFLVDVAVTHQNNVAPCWAEVVEE